MKTSDLRRQRMIGHRGPLPGALGGALLLSALLLAACGQTGGVVLPDTLTISVTTLGTSHTQTYTVRDTAKVQGIYHHIQALPVIPPGASPACRVTRQSYQFAFATNGSAVLTATISQCANILQLPHNVNRAPDTTLWTLLDSATGQRLEPV